MTDDTTRLPTKGAPTHVTVKTPAGGLWDCPIAYLPIALERRYSRVGEDVTVPDDTPEAGGFNPDDHSVGEINDYLASVLEAPGEIERVLAAEAAGKSRTTIVDPRPQVD